MSLFLRVCYILMAIAVVVLCFYVVDWVLGLLGIRVPQHILQVIFVIIGLAAVIAAVKGDPETWWKV